MSRREELSGSTDAVNRPERSPRAADEQQGAGPDAVLAGLQAVIATDSPEDRQPSDSGPLLRIDAPHVLGDRPRDEASAESAPPAEVADEPADGNSTALAPEANLQLRLQAEQLAAHLRAQEYSLDRREAQLHSELAEQEKNGRGMRLWFQERQQELAEREAEIAAKAEELAQRQQDLALLEQELERRQARGLADSQTPFDAAASDDYSLAAQAGAMASESASQEQELADRAAVAALATAEAAAAKSQAEERLADATRIYRQLHSMLTTARRFLGAAPVGIVSSGRAPLSDVPDAGPATGELLQLDAELRAALDQLAARQQNLEEAEVLLADGQTELDRGRQQLAADRQAWQEHRELEQARLADDHRHGQEELGRRQALLSGREEHLSRRGAAVDGLRSEVLRTQRETLELRLATDEVWAQLAGSVPPPALTQSLVRVRSQLADQSRRQQAELSQQREELELLAQRLSEQHERLVAQRQEIEGRAAEERGEIERHAARLAAREQEFEQRQAEFAQLRQRQEGERRVYEAEIRSLLAELRRGSPSPSGRGPG